MILSNKTNMDAVSQKGFSVIEMIVSIGLFAMVVVVALSSVLALVNANEKTRTTKSTLDNLGFSVEEMVRSLRFGQNFYCQTSSSPISITSLSARSECPNGGSYLAFEDKLGFINLYLYDSTEDEKCIMKKTTTVQWGTPFTDTLPNPPGSMAGYSCISSNDIKITNLKFYVHGWSVDSQVQRVSIVINGYAGENPTTQSTFNFMTSVASRKTPVDY